MQYAQAQQPRVFPILRQPSGPVQYTDSAKKTGSGGVQSKATLPDAYDVSKTENLSAPSDNEPCLTIDLTHQKRVARAEQLVQRILRDDIRMVEFGAFDVNGKFRAITRHIPTELFDKAKAGDQTSVQKIVNFLLGMDYDGSSIPGINAIGESEVGLVPLLKPDAVGEDAFVEQDPLTTRTNRRLVLVCYHVVRPNIGSGTEVVVHPKDVLGALKSVQKEWRSYFAQTFGVGRNGVDSPPKELKYVDPKTGEEQTLADPKQWGVRFRVGFETELDVQNNENPEWKPSDNKWYCSFGPNAIANGVDIRAFNGAVLDIADRQYGVTPDTSHPEVMESQAEPGVVGQMATKAVLQQFWLRTVADSYAAARNWKTGYHPKPHDGYNGHGRHMHWSISLVGPEGEIINICAGKSDVSDWAKMGLVGQADHCKALMAFLAYAEGSEKRFGSCEAPPQYFTWRHSGRDNSVRKVEDHSRFELRVDNPSNPAPASLASVMALTLAGIKQGVADSSYVARAEESHVTHSMYEATPGQLDALKAKGLDFSVDPTDLADALGASQDVFVNNGMPRAYLKEVEAQLRARAEHAQKAAAADVAAAKATTREKRKPEGPPEGASQAPLKAAKISTGEGGGVANGDSASG